MTSTKPKLVAKEGQRCPVGIMTVPMSVASFTRAGVTPTIFVDFHEGSDMDDEVRLHLKQAFPGLEIFTSERSPGRLFMTLGVTCNCPWQRLHKALKEAGWPVTKLTATPDTTRTMLKMAGTATA